jgi:peptidoglycan/LPS O-acetylase OafA/YrhL
MGTDSPDAAAPAPASRLSRFLALEPLDNRYPALHGLRVLAIFSVIQYHVTAVLANEHGLPMDGVWRDASLGTFYGMDLFFVLSGFLIGSILLHAQRTTGSQNLRRFYLRRILRTFPAYYLLLAGLLLLGPYDAQQRSNWLHECLYITNYYSMHRADTIALWGWSLGLEEQFYLTVPLLFWLLAKMRSNHQRLVLIAVLWLIPLGLRMYAHFFTAASTVDELHRVMYFRTHTRSDPIIAGIFVALLEGFYHAPISAWLQRPLRKVGLALFALCMLWMIYEPKLLGEDSIKFMQLLHWGTLTSLLHICVLLLLLHSTGLLTEWLGHLRFRKIATVGYGVYLLHMPILDYAVVPIALRAHAQNWPMLAIWPSAVAVTFVGAILGGYLTHILVEKPALWLRQKLAA